MDLILVWMGYLKSIHNQSSRGLIVFDLLNVYLVVLFVKISYEIKY